MPHKVRLLGSVEILLDTERGFEPAPASVYRSRKVALLTYLLMTNRPVRRLEIAALLWPDTDARRGRGSLNQLLVEMRRELGAASFVSRDDDELMLAAGAFECDACDLERAHAAGRFADVAALYGGAVLDGFATTSLDAFADWLDRTRFRISDAVADAALQSAARAADPAIARRSLDAAAQLRPYDEAILRRRMTLAADCGNAAEAVAMFESHRARIAAELAVAPATETRKLAIALCAPTDNDEPLLLRAPAPTLMRSTHAPRRGVALRVAASVILVLGSLLAFAAIKRAHVPVRKTVDVALINSGDASRPALRALPGLVATYLIRDSSINVESANSASAFQVVADLDTDNDEISGTVQIRNHGSVIASTALHSSMRLGMDTIAAELAHYVSDVVSPTESYATPRLAINAARQHLLYARADYARGVRANAALELHRAQLQLDSVGHSARDGDWRDASDAITRERVLQSRSE